MTVTHRTRVGGHKRHIITAHVGFTPKAISLQPFAIPSTFRIIKAYDSIFNFICFFIPKSKVSVSNSIFTNTISKINPNNFWSDSNQMLQNSMQGIILTESHQAFYLRQRTSNECLRDFLDFKSSVGRSQILLGHFLDLSRNRTPRRYILKSCSRLQQHSRQYKNRNAPNFCKIRRIHKGFLDKIFP